MQNTTFNNVRYIEIDDKHKGQRIDNFLLVKLKGVPKTHIYKILRSGEVRVNKGRVKPVYKLKYGDMIRIPPVRHRAEHKNIQPPENLSRQILKSIIYEDDDLIALNKPAGIAVHGGSGIRYGVIEIIRSVLPHEPSLELVHRLDRATSGCLVIAKNRLILNELHDLLKADYGIKKHYTALVKGRWDRKKSIIDTPLINDGKSGYVRPAMKGEIGKKAKTVITSNETFSKTTLLDITIPTGRTHQIRVHTASAGFPVVGDDKYGDFAFNKIARKQGLKRMFLHAHSLKFKLKKTAKEYHFTADLPDDLNNYLSLLKSERS